MKYTESLTLSYISRAEIWLFATTLIYFLMNGAQIFETLVFVPKWASDPPTTFDLLDGAGIGLKSFWTIFHGVHEIIFILAIIFCWKIDPVRNWLLLLFIIHFAVRVWTILYFAPDIIDFQKIALTLENPTELVKRTANWKMWNYLRVGLFLAVSIGLVPICIKLLKIRASF